MRTSVLLATCLLTANTALSLGGCGERDEYAEQCRQAPLCQPPALDPIDPAGVHFQYVVDSIEFGETSQERLGHALDLDCVSPGRVDNQLGNVLAAVYSSLSTDLDQLVAETVADGRVIHLVDVQATDLGDAASVGVRVFVGRDVDGDPGDNFSGQGVFAVDASAPAIAMSGVITGGRLEVIYGEVPLQVALPGIEEVSLLSLTAARAEGTVTADRLALNVGGGMTERQVDSDFLMVALTAIQSVIGSECPGGVCPDGSRGALLLSVLDADRDGAVTFDELRESAVVESLLAPDIDLVDDGGRLNPGCDGTADALSLAVELTAVPAQFDLP